MRALIVLVVAIFVMGTTGCATSAIVPFRDSSTVKNGVTVQKFAPVPAESVGIYRSTNPFVKFTELGLISFRSGAYALASMYDQIRKDAGAYGAQAVIDTKITGETHTEMVSVQNCMPVTTCDASGACSTDSNCQTEMVPKEVSSFLIEGSMVREKND